MFPRPIPIAARTGAPIQELTKKAARKIAGSNLKPKMMTQDNAIPDGGQIRLANL